MISFKRQSHATDTAIVALILFHLVIWFKSMGGTGGITSSITYPFSLFVAPVVIWVMALAVFYLLIYPIAIGVRLTCNRVRLTRLHGFLVSFIFIALLAALPARALGGAAPMATWLTWIGYLSAGFAAFWHYGTSRA